MQPSNAPLQDLRDVHLPGPIALWPPAHGWWIVLGVVVTGIIVFLWIRAYRRRTKPRRLAIAEFNAVKQQYGIHHDDYWAVQRLSEIVRRYALAIFSRTEVAGLAGPSWLLFLDRTSGTNQFTEGAGQLLCSGAYRPPNPESAAVLFPLVERWIQCVSPSTGGNSA
jgi:hypothetical protein